MKRSNGVTLIELLFVVGIFLFMILILTPFVNMAKARARKIDCANNLRHISLALHKYAAGHRDTFPATIGELYPKYLDDRKVFDCPSTRNRGIPDKIDYIYTAGLSEASAPKTIIVQDADGNHKKSGRNVLRVDGSVDWVSERH